MSDGLKFIATVLINGSTALLRDVDETLFLPGPEADGLALVKSHYRQYQQLPTLATVEAELQQQLPTRLENPEYHLDRMKDRNLYNRIRPKFAELRGAIKDVRHDDMRRLVGDLHALASLGGNSPNRILTADEVYASVIRQYERDRPLRGIDIAGITTGWDWLDEQSGGWQPADIITIAGRMSMGKTYILMHCIYSAWAAAKSVMVFTTEMPAQQLGLRLIGYQTGVDPRLVRRNTLSPWGERRLIEAITVVQGDDKLKMVSAAGKSTAWVEEIVQEFQPDIVFIDGVYLLQPSSGKREAGRYEKIANVFDDVNAMKLRTNKPIVVTTQMSREAGSQGRSGSLENLGYSDAIGTHSSIVMQIKPWPHWARCDLDNFAPESARIIETLKGREGPIPPFAIYYRPPQHFERIPNAVITRDEAREGTREEREQMTNFMVGEDSDNSDPT
jgi:replicative DNA helicase